MRIFFKYVSLLIILVMLFSLIIGCGSSDTGTTTGQATTQGTSATVTETEKKAPDVVKMVIRNRWAGVSYDNQNTSYIEEKTNTKWDLTVIPGGELENKVNILLASGERPDVIQYSTDAAELKYAQSDLLLPLNQYMDKAPNLDKNWGDLWDIMKHDDGNVYAIPVRGSKVDFLPLYRQDWLTKLGMQVPKTIDEYYNYAVAIANNDPDGNGKKDTYAFGSCGLEDFRYFDHIFGAFGSLPGFWMSVEGKLVEGSVVPGAKDALLLLNKLYKAGALDPEFITDNTDRTDQKVKTGIYGATCNYYAIMDTNNLYGYYDAFKTANPNGEWVAGGILQALGFNGVGMRVLSQRGWIKTSVLKATKNVDAVMRILDWLTSDEGQMFANYGLEGQHYKVENDVVIRLVPQDDYQKLGISQVYLAMNFLVKDTSKVFQQAEKESTALGVVSPSEGIMVPEDAKYTQTLNDYTKMMFAKMILGEVVIDGGFEDYVAEWGKRGGDELTTAFNNGYLARKK